MATATLTLSKTDNNKIVTPISATSQVMNIRIRVLHAVDHPEIAQKFYQGQLEVLNEFKIDISKIDSIKEKWWENPGSYMFIAEDIETGEIGAGIRLDVIDPTHPIPLEKALKDPNLDFRLHKHNHILAETCGWWVKKSFSARNLPHILTRAAISVADKLRIKIILGFANPYTKKTIEVFGFHPVNNLGQNATYNYPNKNYPSTVMEFYLTELNNAPKEEIEIINNLRKYPIQKTKEEFKGKLTHIEYDLGIR